MSTKTLDVELLIGPPVVICILASFLTGVATVQAYHYYQTFPNDRMLLKSVVAFTWILDVVNMATNSAGLYVVCVRYFGHPEKFLNAPKVLFAAIFVAAAIYFIVQGFFSYRVWVITRIPTLGILCSFLTLLRVGSVLALGGTALGMKSLIQYSDEYWWLLTLSIIAGTVGDTLTSASLSWALWRKKERLFDATSQVVDRVILWTMQTGIMISIATITLLITFLTMPHNWIWMSIMFLIPRLYTTSLLSSLNGRKSLRKMSSGGAMQLSLPSTDQPTHNHPPISIEMTTSTTRHIERDPRQLSSKGSEYSPHLSSDDLELDVKPRQYGAAKV